MPKPKGKSGKSIRPAGKMTEAEMDSLLPRIARTIRQNAEEVTLDCSRVGAIDASQLISQ